MSTIFYGGGACGLRVCASAHALTSADAPDGGAIGTSRNAAPAQYWCVVARPSFVVKSTIDFGGEVCGLRGRPLHSTFCGAIGTSRNAAPAQYWCVVAHTVSFTEDPNNVLFSVKA